MKFTLVQLRKDYLDLKWERKILVSAALLSLIPLLAIWLWPASAPVENAHQRHAEVDTFIPKGFVLVPIEVRNYEALDSVLGKFALVDLYQGGTPEAPRQRLVGRNVRLLRAPQNPSHFAVLVQEEGAADLLANGAEFTVIIKRPSGGGTEFVKEIAKTHRKIVYEGGAK